MSDTAHARPFSASFSRVLGLLLLSSWFARFWAHFGKTRHVFCVFLDSATSDHEPTRPQKFKSPLFMPRIINPWRQIYSFGDLLILKSLRTEVSLSDEEL